MKLMGGGTDEQMKKVKKKRVAGKPKMGHTCCTLLSEFMEFAKYSQIKFSSESKKVQISHFFR